MTYSKWQDYMRKKTDELPVFFAFSKDQFRREMEKRGLTENDTDRICRFGGFGFYLKEDSQAIADWINDSCMLKTYMKDPAFAEDAFYYEMCNHEYGINSQGEWDVCQCFGECEYGYGKNAADYLTEIGFGADIIHAYKKAEHRYYQDAIEQEWF